MKATIQFSDTDDLLDIRYDNVFKAVFTKDTPASKAALSDLISALIGHKVKAVLVIANEPAISDIHDRCIRFDIACKSETGQLINVEMSLEPDVYEKERLEFYAARLFTGQDIHGTGKDYADLKEAYQIAILAKNRFFPDEVFLHSFEYYDPFNKIPLNGRSRIITLELSKLEEVVEKPVAQMSVQEYWAVYFRYLNLSPRLRTL